MNKSNLSLTLIVFIFLLAIYPLVEAGLVSAANPETVVVQQQVTAEISMTVASTSMAMLPSIAGLTGGTGNASTSVNIITNNKEGYTVTIRGTSTGTGLGDATMNGDTTAGYISDYSATTAETWTDTTSGQASQFGFGVTNTSLSSANGATGYGTCAGVEACWSKLATTTAKTIVSVSTFTPTVGDTFHVKFRAHIPANSNPLVPEDWYTATATITAAVI